MAAPKAFAGVARCAVSADRRNGDRDRTDRRLDRVGRRDRDRRLRRAIPPRRRNRLPELGTRRDGDADDHHRTGPGDRLHGARAGGERLRCRRLVRSRSRHYRRIRTGLRRRRQHPARTPRERCPRHTRRVPGRCRRRDRLPPRRSGCRRFPHGCGERPDSHAGARLLRPRGARGVLGDGHRRRRERSDRQHRRDRRHPRCRRTTRGTDATNGHRGHLDAPDRWLDRTGEHRSRDRRLRRAVP